MRFLRDLRSIGPILMLFPFISLLMTGCGGSGSSDDPPNTTNLSATSVKILNADGIPDVDPLLMVEHPFTIAIGIAATEAVEGVAVDFFILGKDSFDAVSDDVPDESEVLEDYFFVGTTYLENLTAGENVRKVELSLPYTTWMEAADNEGVVSTVYKDYFPIPNTDYYLVAVIDPGDLIEETDEEDNRPSEDNIDETMVIVQVSDQYNNTPNLILEEILVEVPNFELKAMDPVEVNSCGEEVPVDEDELNPHVKVTAVINASGKYWPDFPDGAPQPIPWVILRASLMTPGIPEIPDEIPIQIWNTNTSGTYMDQLLFRDFEPGTPMSVSLEMRLNVTEPQLQFLIGELASKSADCFEKCDLDEVCFAAEMIAGTVCDQEDFIYCGGTIDLSDPQNPIPVTTNLDWGCYMNRIDGECLDQCEPDLGCMLVCTEDLVSLYVHVMATDEMGWPLEVGEDLVISHELEKELVLLPTPDPDPTGPVMFETGYDKGFSAKLAYAGLKANVWAGLDTGGASAGLEAALPVVLFKGAPSSCNPYTQDCPFGYKPSEIFLGVRSAIGALPDQGQVNQFENLATVDIYAFGQNLFPKVLDFGCGNEDAITLWSQGGLQCALDCNTQYPTLPNESLQYKKARADCLQGCWAFGKSTAFNKNFVVGVVPLTASFAAWGLIGAEVSMGVTASCGNPLSFEAHTGPWASLGTEVTAGVGTGAFSAGVGGELDPLLEDTFFATVSIIDLASDGINVTGALHEDITNTLTGPQGNIFFYVRYPCIKFCKVWGIPFPCGFKPCQAKKNIVGFTTFEREDVLFCDEQPFVGSIQ